MKTTSIDERVEAPYSTNDSHRSAIRVFFHNRTHLPASARYTAVILEYTGTPTSGHPHLTDWKESGVVAGDECPYWRDALHTAKLHALDAGFNLQLVTRAIGAVSAKIFENSDSFPNPASVETKETDPFPKTIEDSIVKLVEYIASTEENDYTEQLQEHGKAPNHVYHHALVVMRWLEGRTSQDVPAVPSPTKEG